MPKEKQKTGFSLEKMAQSTLKNGAEDLRVEIQSSVDAIAGYMDTLDEREKLIVLAKINGVIQSARISLETNLSTAILKGEIAQKSDKNNPETQVQILLMDIEELGLSNRTMNALSNWHFRQKIEEIKFVGDLVQLDQKDILSINNLGKNCFQEITAALQKLGLNLGMKFDKKTAKAFQQNKKALNQETENEETQKEVPLAKLLLPVELLIPDYFRNPKSPKTNIEDRSPKKENLRFLGDVIQKSFNNFYFGTNLFRDLNDKISIKEMEKTFRKILASHGLSFGMVLDEQTLTAFEEAKKTRG